jgi:hypothetical protein
MLKEWGDFLVSAVRYDANGDHITHEYDVTLGRLVSSRERAFHGTR